MEVEMPPVYASHAVYETVEVAKETAYKQIRGGFEFEIRKGKIESYTEEDFKARCELVQEVNLP